MTRTRRKARMLATRGKIIGGRRQSHAQREEIIALFMESPEAAQQLAESRGLSPMYAYRLAHERGVVPRLRREWGKYREISA